MYTSVDCATFQLNSRNKTHTSDLLRNIASLNVHKAGTFMYELEAIKIYMSTRTFSISEIHSFLFFSFLVKGRYFITRKMT